MAVYKDEEIRQRESVVLFLRVTYKLLAAALSQIAIGTSSRPLSLTL